MIPRDYQNDAVYSIWNYFKANKGNPIVAAPTGTGKSLIIASFIKSVYHYYPGQRILMVTHVKELIEQNFEKLLLMWPTAPAGIYSAGLKRKDLGCPITFAGIASIDKIVKDIGHIDIVIVDEAHLVPPNPKTRYGKFFLALLKINPHVKIIGLTATPYRNGQGLLTEQPSIFTDICYDSTTLKGFNELVERGYLAPLIPKPTNTIIDVSQVGERGGEFINKDLQLASDKEEITMGALKETMAIASDRKHWLIFATGIEHAKHIQEMLDLFDVDCGIVTGVMNNTVRDEEIGKFTSGHYRAMVTVGVLTTGFDFPEIDLIVMLRPTNSASLWVQMLGRGTRPAEGKNDCMVLDFAGNTLRLGPINDPLIPQPKGKKKGKGTAPVRVCESCNTYIHASLRVCPHCGHEIEIQVKFSTTSGTNPLMITERKIEPPEIITFKVDKAVYKIHRKMGKPDSIKVTYYCGLRIFNEWVCVLHTGYPLAKARNWWRKAGKAEIDFPEDIEQAMELVHQLRIPETIEVQVNLKYPEIFKHNYL